MLTLAFKKKIKPTNKHSFPATVAVEKKTRFFERQKGKVGINSFLSPMFFGLFFGHENSKI